MGIYINFYSLKKLNFILKYKCGSLEVLGVFKNQILTQTPKVLVFNFKKLFVHGEN
jgi:hypothetical protein